MVRSPVAATPASQQRRVALVIGNGAYTGGLQPLPNPRHDAEDVCAAVQRLGFKVVCVFDVPTRNELRVAVRSFVAQLGPDSLSLFYYAGHAIQSRGENFLIPVSAAHDNALDVEDNSLSLNYVLRGLEDARSAPNIVIVDGCREDPFTSSAGGGTARGLARVDPPVGTVLVYATAPGATALDGDGRNGLFTKHLLLHLPTPGLKLTELLQQVARGVEEEARTAYQSEQVPYRSFSYSGSICLAGCDAAGVAEQLADLRAQSEAAGRRIAQLESENTRLASRADGRGGPASSSAGDQREAELAVLRGQVQQMRSQSALLEDYQRRIKLLEREKAERPVTTGLDKPGQTLIVPSF